MKNPDNETVKPSFKRKEVRSPNYLTKIFSISISFLVALLFLQQSIDNIRLLWQSNQFNRIGIVSILFSLVLWLFSWIAFDAYETDELGKQASKWMRPPHRIYGIIIGLLIAFAFGLMVANITNIPVLIALLSLVVLGATWGDNLVISGLTHDIVLAGKKIDNHFLDYYLNHPHMLLHSIQLFMIIISAIIYFLLRRIGVNTREWIIYFVLSFSILLNEITLWKWRFKRLRINGTSQ